MSHHHLLDVIRFLLLLVLIVLKNNAARGDVWLDYQWGESMTLQSGVTARLHGTARGAKHVVIAFRSQQYKTEVDRLGNWNLNIDPGSSGGPFELTIRGDDSETNKQIQLKHVRVEDLIPASIFSDGMVLQQGDRAPIFGTTVPSQKVRIRFRNQTWDTVADASGAFQIAIAPGAAGGPFPLTIEGPTTISWSEVYVGEVWVCSGQSNMRWGVTYTKDHLDFPIGKTNPLLRLQLYPELGYAPNHPVGRFNGWRAAERKSIFEFSATGYYFGAALQEKLQCPVGLVMAAVDATRISEWLPGKQRQELRLGSSYDGGHYARRVRTMQPFAIRGVIWYQGEADAVMDPLKIGYERQLTALIQGWRNDWGQGNFPFLFVQLPRLGFGPEQVHRGQLPTEEQKTFVGEWPRVRDEQRRVLAAVPNSAMAIYYEKTSGLLHPDRKKPAGERLALAARALAYEEKIEHSGPLVANAKLLGDEIEITFTHAEGLSANDGEPRQFEIAAQDGQYVAVPARIIGNTVRLKIGNLPSPLTVRYAYRQWPDGNLFNSAGLPASPFSVHVE